MRIRTATKEDAPRIAALHAASWRIAYRGMLSEAYLNGDIVAERTAVWSKRLTGHASGQHVVLAEINDTLAGFACAFGASDPQWGTLLDNLHVTHELKRRGIGAHLMSAIAEWCSIEQAGKGLFLWVLEPNFSARRFYGGLGAVNSGQDVWTPPGGGAVPKLRYSWRNLEPLLQRG